MKSCEGIPCGRHGQCIPLVNDSYTCVCLPGYEGVNCRRRTNQLDEKTTQLPTESSSLSQENRTVNIAIETGITVNQNYVSVDQEQRTNFQHKHQILQHTEIFQHFQIFSVICLLLLLLILGVLCWLCVVYGGLSKLGASAATSINDTNNNNVSAANSKELPKVKVLYHELSVEGNDDTSQAWNKPKDTSKCEVIIENELSCPDNISISYSSCSTSLTPIGGHSHLMSPD